MTLADLITILAAVFQFPSALLEFVKLLKKTPIEQHEQLIQEIQEVRSNLDQTGRPTWPH